MPVTANIPSPKFLRTQFIHTILKPKFDPEDNNNQKLSLSDFRKMKKIGEDKLTQIINHVIDYCVPIEQHRLLKQALFHNNGLHPEFITEFEKEIGMNIIKRNPSRTVLSLLGTAAGAFGGTLLGIIIFELCTSAALFTSVGVGISFLAALGPIGATMVMAAFVTFCALALYGMVVGIMAGASHQNFKVIHEPVQSMSSGLGGLGSAQDKMDPYLASTRPYLKEGFGSNPRPSTNAQLIGAPSLPEQQSLPQESIPGDGTASGVSHSSVVHPKFSAETLALYPHLRPNVFG